ncbi:MAG: DNA-binding protein WhiA, partial [Ruminococcus sp.]|nr:DNA-binding protein WhiA [Ruminococcus sp.]
MSFSSDVKLELSKFELKNKEQKYAQLYGMLLFSSLFTSREIVFKTENRFSASIFEKLLIELFNPIVERQSDLKPNSSSLGLYKILLPVPDECKTVYEFFGHTQYDINLKINRANIESEDLYSHFLRGVFLSCGSVTNPDKGYHLELMVKHKTLADNLMHFIGEIDVFSVNPKVTPRKGSYLVYIKGSNNICDMLGFMGAGNSVMRIIETSAYKDLKNDLNRRHNSELSNIRKLADASAKQVRAIQRIEKSVGLDSLPSELIELSKLRLEYPEMSLKELSQKLGISRSGVNHRIERIYKFADNLTED